MPLRTVKCGKKYRIIFGDVNILFCYSSQIQLYRLTDGGYCHDLFREIFDDVDGSMSALKRPPIFHSASDATLSPKVSIEAIKIRLDICPFSNKNC